MAPPPKQEPQPEDDGVYDDRQRSAKSDGYNEKLDNVLSLTNKSGPLLSADGKPLRPFTLLDNRETIKQGVFRSGHNLPTMTIDEYLDEERRRGNIIEGGGYVKLFLAIYTLLTISKAKNPDSNRSQMKITMRRQMPQQ